MALPELVRQFADAKLKAFCTKRMPPHARTEIRLYHQVRGNNVTLIEARPLFRAQAEWSELKIAQFRFNPKPNTWTLYCADRNGRWHLYFDAEPSERLEELLEEVDADPTGIFWG